MGQGASQIADMCRANEPFVALALDDVPQATPSRPQINTAITNASNVLDVLPAEVVQ